MTWIISELFVRPCHQLAGVIIRSSRLGSMFPVLLMSIWKWRHRPSPGFATIVRASSRNLGNLSVGFDQLSTVLTRGVGKQ